MINILITDDQQIIIEGLKSLLSREESFNIVSQAKNGIEAIKQLKLSKIDVILMDINMPKMGGLEATKIINKEHPNVKILILSMYNRPELIRTLIEAGANGFLIKNASQPELVSAVKKVHAGGEYYSPEVKDTMMHTLKTKDHIGAAYLTDRERLILKLLADGNTTIDIAYKLTLSPHTIDTHRKNLLNKLDKKNIASLVKYAVENGYAGEQF
ncbi:MAG: response regulator transcription factor [Reichenbachiella sp.]